MLYHSIWINTITRLNKKKKKKKNYVSQSLWRIGIPDLNAFFFKHVFVFFFFFLSSRRVKFESVTTLFSIKYGTWFLDEQDWRQNKELKKSVVQSDLLCLSCPFMYILTGTFLKNWEKIKQTKKKKKIKAWILLNQTRNEKQTRVAAFFFFFFFYFMSKHI